ncbi:2-oxo acid dehydrogenase subunit E2 [Candidatus Kaiserbacteria bacterium]|nr:2-oxo acid dehydrogenase subunit E2 [Candidatus Kaiserbacteria bacterium]
MTGMASASHPPGTLILKPSQELLRKAHGLEGLNNRLTYTTKERRVVVAGGEPIAYNLYKLLAFKKELDYRFQEVLHVRVRPWMFVALAVARVLTRDAFATLNGYWNTHDTDQKYDSVALYASVHLGFSYDRGTPPRIDREQRTIGEGTPGLRILTLRDAHMKSCAEFLASLDDLLKRADLDTRKGTRIKDTKLEEWTGATFIFNNIGALRHARGWSILSPHISALMNMGHIAPDGTATFQIFFDHRMCDGSLVTAFTDAVYEELGRVLTEVNALIA